jgi:hypothetical protein
MGELRLGTAYRADVRTLSWFGVGAGVEYIDETNLYPSPALAIAAGGDLRLSGALWFELSLSLAGAQMIGSNSIYSGTYVTFGLEFGTRFDLTR